MHENRKLAMSIDTGNTSVPWPGTCHGRWMSPEYEPRLVCVIIPTYNRARLVRPTQASCRKQAVLHALQWLPALLTTGSDRRVLWFGHREGMARSMLQLLRDARLAERMGAAGRRRVMEHFDARKQIRKLRAVLGLPVADAAYFEGRPSGEPFPDADGWHGG